MLTTYVKIIEATKPVFRRWGEETGEFLLVYVFDDKKKLDGAPNFGFDIKNSATYDFNGDPRFFSLRIEEKFGNGALLEYSNFVWIFCLPAEKRADLEKLLKGAEA